MTRDESELFDRCQREQFVELLTKEARYLTTSEVASHLRVAPETLRYWRYIGTGPPSWKAGRRVLYARSDLEEWIRNERKAGQL